MANCQTFQSGKMPAGQAEGPWFYDENKQGPEVAQGCGVWHTGENGWVVCWSPLHIFACLPGV